MRLPLTLMQFSTSMRKRLNSAMMVLVDQKMANEGAVVFFTLSQWVLHAPTWLTSLAARQQTSSSVLCCTCTFAELHMLYLQRNLSVSKGEWAPVLHLCPQRQPDCCL